MRWSQSGARGGSGAFYRADDPLGYWLAVATAALGLWMCGKIAFELYRRCMHPDAAARGRK